MRLDSLPVCFAVASLALGCGGSTSASGAPDAGPEEAQVTDGGDDAPSDGPSDAPPDVTREAGPATLLFAGDGPQ
ncbi:MAG TPA: hypothetical protein VIF15_02055, partial [Polyangiaceae bacterium]